MTTARLTEKLFSFLLIAILFGPNAVFGQKIPANKLFVLTPAERALFGTNPPATPGVGYEEQPLCNIFNAFNTGKYPVPLNPNVGPSGWYELNGKGSQNHAILWQGECALAYALKGDQVNYEIAAKNCIKLLALDRQQGHERQESFGKYNGFWESAMASMALAGLYAPANCPSGPKLLADARLWWKDHIAVFRRLRMPDGQIAQVGSRSGGEPGTYDDWHGLSAALNMQIMDPIPYTALYPTLAKLLTADGKPNTNPKKCMVHWDGVGAANEHWLVYRAFQTGAIVVPAATYPVPLVVQTIYKWTKNGRTYIGTPKVTGYRPARWEVSWKAGELCRNEVGDPNGSQWGGKGPHLPPAPQKVVIPSTAKKILGPAGLTGKMADAADPAIMDVELNQDANTVAPEIFIRNNGTQSLNELTVFWQMDGGEVRGQEFTASIEAGEQSSFQLDNISVPPGCHELTVYLDDREAAVVRIEGGAAAIAEQFNVNVFPNPASESLQISVELEKSGELTLRVVNALGETIEEINAGMQDAGTFISTVDVRSYPVGIYDVFVVSGDAITAEKIIVSH